MYRFAISLFVITLGLIAKVSAEQTPTVPTDKGPSVRQFMTSDGRIDIDAVRRSGYQGPLDLHGVNMRVDPRGGAPIVSTAPAQSSASDPDDIYWDNSISPTWSIPGIDGQVNAMATYNGTLIVAGWFTRAGDVAVNNIASWDGSSWSPLGSGVDGGVYAMTEYNGKLIAGGDFITIGGVAAKRIAAWDGSSWSPLGLGLDTGGVGLMTVYGGKLIVAGGFSRAGSVSANCIASWDGIEWSALGWGLIGPSYVGALAVYGDKLIVGGSFNNAGYEVARGMAAWDGVSWSSFGMGRIDTTAVREMTVYDGKLVVAGTYVWNGETIIESWDGSSWSRLGERRWYCTIWDLVVFDGKLIVGSFAMSVDNYYTWGPASWDGSAWSPIATGLGRYSPEIYNLAVYDGKLIAVGNFDRAGELDVHNIAAWDGIAWSRMGPPFDFDGAVTKLEVYNGELIAGGDVSTRRRHTG
ncbi:MAG: hypothetical protein HY851_00205 [candidate division Zixibacteria bacterium]|nr:hypothetical protein [candidate division Zixibacteria bacterium]